MNEAAACATLAVLILLSSCRGTEAFKPFPRVGRSGDVTWEFSSDALKSKRQAGLFPFPRVGRSGDVTWEFGTGIPGYICPTCFGPRGRVLGASPSVVRDDANLFSQTPKNVPKEDSRGEGKRQGLIPFPRVGRAGPAVAWPAGEAAGAAAARRFRPGAASAPLPAAAALLLMDAAPELARRSAVGDAGGDDGGDGSEAMWFGPRLGRRSRRSLPLDGPWTIVPLRELPSSRRHDGAGRVSDEDEEEDAVAPTEDGASDGGRRGAAGGTRRARAAPTPFPRVG